jgi:hypothetical protein
MNKKIKIDRFYPEEIILQIAQFLSIKKYYKLLLVDKFWFNVISNTKYYKIMKGLSEIPLVQCMNECTSLKNGMFIVNKISIPNKKPKRKLKTHIKFYSNLNRCFLCDEISTLYRHCPGCRIYFCEECSNKRCPSNCNVCSNCNKFIDLYDTVHFICIKCHRLFCSDCKSARFSSYHISKFHGRKRRNIVNLNK